MTLNGAVALILSYFTEFGSFRGALRKSVEDPLVYSAAEMWMKNLVFSLYF